MEKKTIMTWGADPEIFVRVQEEIVPVCGLVGGTKGNPVYPLKDISEFFSGVGLLEDNAALELNFPIAYSPQNLIKNVGKVIEKLMYNGIPLKSPIPSEYLREYSDAQLLQKATADVTKMAGVPKESVKRASFLQAYLEDLKMRAVLDKSLKISTSSQHEFSKKYLEKFPELCAIGCDPDFSAYGERVLPNADKMGGWRFAAGHIHIGIDPWPADLPKDVFVKFLDLLITCKTISYDRQGRRRAWYGLPGLYRPKPYGVEYRTPSNSWVLQAPKGGSHIKALSQGLEAVHRVFSNYEMYATNLVRLYQNIEWSTVEKAISLEQVEICHSLNMIALNELGLGSSDSLEIEDLLQP